MLLRVWPCKAPRVASPLVDCILSKKCLRRESFYDIAAPPSFVPLSRAGKRLRPHSGISVKGLLVQNRGKRCTVGVASMSMQRAHCEAVLIAGAVSWASSALLQTSPHSCLALVLLLAFGLLGEHAADSSSLLKFFKSRPRGSPGVAVGAITLPLLFASKLLLEEEAPSVAGPEIPSTLLFWAVTASSAAFCASVLLSNSRQSSSEEQQTAGAGPWLLTGGAVCAWGASLLGSSGFYGNPEAVAVWLGAHTAATGLLLRYVYRTFPYSATAGEGLLVAQGVVLFLGDAVLRTVARALPWLPLPPHCLRSLSGPLSETFAVLQALLLGLSIFAALYTQLACQLPDTSRRTKEQAQPSGVHTVAFYLLFVAVVLLLAPLWLMRILSLEQHPILWAVSYVLADAPSRLGLCCYWLVCLAAPLGLLQTMAADRTVAKVLVRKGYHLMATAMFVPALLYQADFLRLAFGVALAAFVFLETARVHDIPPLGPLVHGLMDQFTDSRDAGLLIISHFSLLLGCALPLWLASDPAKHSLVPFAGVLSVGIGDTMASVVGVKLGRTRLCRDSSKTVEGTAAGIASMLVASFGLSFLLPPGSAPQWAGVVLATIGAGLLEAYTTQLDNAFVPLFYSALLSLTLR